MTKRIFILIAVFLLCSGCFYNKDTSKEEIKEVEEPPQEELYTDDNPVKVGLFLSEDSNYHNKKRVDETYYTNFKSGEVLGNFEVILTNDEVIDGNNYREVWNKYYNSYENIEKYKIGFNIKFILEDGTNYSGNFLGPDILRFGEYFQVYLYDDIHHPDGEFYSHLEEVDDDTLMTSIKIFAVDGIDRVQNVIVTVFTYDGEDDFDSNGNYRGNSLYVVRIKRNN